MREHLEKPTSGLPRIPKSSKEQLLKTYPPMTEEESELVEVAQRRLEPHMVDVPTGVTGAMRII